MQLKEIPEFVQKYFKIKDETALSRAGDDHSGVYSHCMGHADAKDAFGGWVRRY